MRQLGQWFTRRYLDDRSLRVVSCTVIVISLVLLVVSFATVRDGRTAFGSELGADYAAFYTAGTILNEYPPNELYNFELQDRLYHQTLPAVPAEEKLPYVNPPFVALLFRPLALLPHSWSVLTWLVIAAGLYAAGLLCAWKALPHVPDKTKATGALLALSFQPFIMDCWLGGQLSVFGFFLIALALLAGSRNRPILAGCAYGLCLYKPTLLVLILPMLVVGRSWRTLLGFTFCAACLAGLSLALVGWRACEDYLRTMLGYVSASTGDTSIFRLWKFVDLNSFLKLLLGGYGNTVVRLAFAIAVACTLPLLVRAWWVLKGSSADYRRLVVAGTITFTPVLNLYVGNYDTIIVVLAVILTASVLRGHAPTHRPDFPPVFTLLLVLLWVTPWFSQVLARSVGFQPFTLVLAATGAYQLTLAGRFAEPAPGSSPRQHTAG